MRDPMMWEHPKIFEVPKPVASGWSSWVAPDPVIPEWSEDTGKKQLFGIELAKGHPSPFMAACATFQNDTSSALWVSINWINDPVVLASRDLYLKTVETDVTLLDKDQLASKLLKFADEKLPNGYPAADDDIRLKSLELYAKIRGYLKPDSANGNTFVHNEMNVRIVGPDKREEKQILDLQPSVTEDSIEPLPLKLSFVK